MTRIISQVKTNITCSSATVIPPTAPQFTYLLPNFPTRLYSLNIAVDSNFQADYSYQIRISTIQQDVNDFQLFPSNQLSYELIPSSMQTGMPLAPNTLIEIFVFNSGGGTSDGHMSVSILATVPSTNLSIGSAANLVL